MNTNSSDDYNTALHESAHAVIATTFKIPAMPEITPGGYSALAQRTEPGTAGLCHFDNGKITPWQSAVISWAGVMGEALYGQRQFWMPPLKPSRLTLRDWHWALLQQINRLSDSDRKGILEYKNTMRSCESAYRLVTKHKTRIVRLARAMTAGRKATPSVPLPDKWPGTHADFLRLICSGDETRFARFITSKAQSHLAGGMAENFESAKQSMTAHFLGTVTDELRARHAGKTDTEIAEVMFAANFASITNLQRTIYAGELTEPAWLKAATDFKAWTETVKNSTGQTNESR